MSNAAELRKIMEEHKLSRSQVARLLGVGDSTVDTWLLPTERRWHRGMPNMALRLLKLEVGEATPTHAETCPPAPPAP